MSYLFKENGREKCRTWVLGLSGMSEFLPLIGLFKKFGIYLLYSTVLVSAVQQLHSCSCVQLCVYISPSSWFFNYYFCSIFLEVGAAMNICWEGVINKVTIAVSWLLYYYSHTLILGDIFKDFPCKISMCLPFLLIYHKQYACLCAQLECN